MQIKKHFLQLILFLIFINLTISRHFDITSKGFSEQKYDTSKNMKRRKMENDDFKPIRILFDATYLEKIETANFAIDSYKGSFERCKNIVSKIISVKPIENPIKLNFSKYNLDKDVVNGTLETGNEQYDLIIITNVNLQAKNEMNSTSILRDPTTKRTVLATIDFENKSSPPKNYFHYFEYLLLHHIIHILGFSYESFEYFDGGKAEIYTTDIDIYGLTRNYIISQKVIEFAKIYYDCDSITKLPLENQHEDKNETHWEAQKFLGEIMSSYTYTADLVLSEFTLKLLEVSGWYEINYYTGGLMRFGKHKGCEFLYEDCSEKFRNEYFKYNKNTNTPSCSSGRQSRTYRVENAIQYNINWDLYNRYKTIFNH
jgi:leishmanolysin